MPERRPDDELRLLEEERRLRRARITAAMHRAEAAGPDKEPDEADAATGPAAGGPGGLSGEEPDEDDDAARRRFDQQALWVDLQVRDAMARGEFDDLPGAGKPIRDLGSTHDPDWWVKRLVEREDLTGVGPPALALRREDAELDARLDRETTEDGVRRTVEDFNRRVVAARRQLQGGPPVVTPTRDPDEEVRAWRERREERRARQREHLTAPASAPARPERRPRWLRRRSRRRRAG